MTTPNQIPLFITLTLAQNNEDNFSKEIEVNPSFIAAMRRTTIGDFPATQITVAYCEQLYYVLETPEEIAKKQIEKLKSLTLDLTQDLFSEMFSNLPPDIGY